MNRSLCSYRGCNKRTAKYFMGWVNDDGQKEWGLVCASHDKLLGRKNLMAAGMTLDEAIKFEADMAIFADTS